jgi:hypothetical protein
VLKKLDEEAGVMAMAFSMGERVYWGTPEVIYLEGSVVALDEEAQIVNVHIERTTPHSAHLIGSDVPFAVDGVKPLVGNSPPGTTSEYSTQHKPLPPMSDEEKLRRAAAAAVHQQYGYTLPVERERRLIEQVMQLLSSDPTLRGNIIASMDEVLQRKF